MHRCHQDLWLPKRLNIPCLSQSLETQHSILPGIPVSLTRPPVRATASTPKFPGILPHSFQLLDARLILGCRPANCLLSETVPRQLAASHSMCSLLLWRPEKRRARLQHEGHNAISPLVRGSGTVVTASPSGQREIDHRGTFPRRSSFNLCPGLH